MNKKQSWEEEFDRKFPIFCWNTEENGWEKVSQEEIKKFFQDSIDMANKEGKQQMADNIVEIIENEKEKGYEDRQILEGILTRCKVGVKLWD